MVTVGMNYQVVPGKEKDFEAVFVKVREIMGALDGHVKTHLYKDVDDPTSYVIFSEWSSKPAFDAFIASPQFRNVANWGKEQILAARPQHRIYGELDAGQPARPAVVPGGCPAHRPT